MSVEILVNNTPAETRVATIENGVLVDVAIERSRARGFVGNIYQGRVARVMPGMQAAFVDIGLDKAGFIHVDDVAYADGSGASGGERASLDVRRYLREGQQLVVQVVKDPIGSKGARLTTHLSLSSRYLVYMPKVNHVGVSQRIEDTIERERLRALVLRAAADSGEGERGGYIVRTAAEGVSDDDLIADVDFVRRMWHVVADKLQTTAAPRCVYHDLPLFLRTLRDMGREGVERIRVDSLGAYQIMSRFAELFSPAMLNIIEHYQGESPLFDLHGVEDELTKSLERRVELKSGGYLIIDQTEAMTTVDVNTGAFIGHRDLEETIFKTNIEAAGAIARQLRLRNLGGIIILDFIDMKDQEHRRQVLRALDKALKNDRAKMTITGVSELGLVQMTRKRTSENLQQMLCEPCPACDGRGFQKSAETVAYEILREVMRRGRVFANEKILVLAAPAVIDRLLDEDAAHRADVEALINRPLALRVETQYARDQYDVILA